jgi:long-chain fatty acid transport protein
MREQTAGQFSGGRRIVAVASIMQDILDRRDRSQTRFILNLRVNETEFAHGARLRQQHVQYWAFRGLFPISIIAAWSPSNAATPVTEPTQLIRKCPIAGQLRRKSVAARATSWLEMVPAGGRRLKTRIFGNMMMAYLRKFLLASSAAAITLATVSAAEAGGFALREQSAYGQGMSFAGVAAGGSLSSMFWNPATLSQVMGLEFESGISGVIPISEVLVTTGPGSPFDEGDIGQDALVPNSYAAYRVNDKVIVGVGINGPFGLSTEYSPGGVIAMAGLAGVSDIFSLNVNPNVAYQINDYVTIAAGLQIQYSDAEINPIAGGVGLGLLDGDDISFGFTAGIHIMASENTEIGLGYRSWQDVDLDGTFVLGVTPFPNTASLVLPDMVTFGIRHKVNDYWRVMAGLEWTNWSRFDTVFVTAPGAPPLPFDYNDGWYFSVGAEYMWNDQITLRGGVGWEISPLDVSNRTFRLPDDDRLWLSLGGSYKANDRYSFDVGYSFLTTFDTQISPSVALGGSGPAANAFWGGEADANVHILSAALKVKLGGHASP